MIKCFNNKDTSPLYTLQLACHEASAWKMAQVMDSVITTEENAGGTNQAHESVAPTSRWRCQIDASRKETSDGT